MAELRMRSVAAPNVTCGRVCLNWHRTWREAFDDAAEVAKDVVGLGSNVVVYRLDAGGWATKWVQR